MATISAAYRCGNCGEWHDCEEYALECCAPRADDGWKCDACGAYHKLKTGAQNCCNDVFKCLACDEPHETEEAASACCGIQYAYQPTPAELEAAGQQRLIP